MFFFSSINNRRHPACGQCSESELDGVRGAARRGQQAPSIDGRANSEVRRVSGFVGRHALLVLSACMVTGEHQLIGWLLQGQARWQNQDSTSVCAGHWQRYIFEK